MFVCVYTHAHSHQGAAEFFWVIAAVAVVDLAGLETPLPCGGARVFPTGSVISDEAVAVAAMAVALSLPPWRHADGLMCGEMGLKQINTTGGGVRRSVYLSPLTLFLFLLILSLHPPSALSLSAPQRWPCLCRELQPISGLCYWKISFYTPHCADGVVGC